MKVFLVHPGREWGSLYISRYAGAALRDAGGEVVSYDLHHWMRFYRTLIDHLDRDGRLTPYEGMLEQISCERIPMRVIEEEPDLFLSIQGALLPGNVVAAVRRLGVRTAVWLLDDPQEIDQSVRYASAYDWIFTSDRNAVPIHAAAGGAAVRYLPTACAPEIFKESPRLEEAFASDILFLGSGFSERVEFLERCEPFLSKYDLRLVGLWENLSRTSRLRSRVVEGVCVPVDAARYYQNAKIVLNLHRDGTGFSVGSNIRRVPTDSPNPRCFEAAGCGSFVLSDDSRPGLGRALKIGEEIEVFSGVRDLREKIEYYLAHEDERGRIARAGRARVLREHTYRRRIASMLSAIEEGAAPQRRVDAALPRDSARSAAPIGKIEARSPAAGGAAAGAA